MLANFFGKSKPVNFILILVLYILYDVLFLYSYDFDVTIKGLLPRIIGVFFLMLLLFLLFNFIISKNKLTKDNTYAFFIFVMSLGLLPNLISDVDTVFFYVILLLFVRKIYSLRRAKAIFAKLFDSAFWLGIAFLLEPVSVLYFVLIYGAYKNFLEITVFSTILSSVFKLWYLDRMVFYYEKNR